MLTAGAPPRSLANPGSAHSPTPVPKAKHGPRVLREQLLPQGLQPDQHPRSGHRVSGPHRVSET